MTDFSELAIAGRIAAPSDPDWDEARLAWNLAADQRPEAVVFAENAEDVAATVRFAAAQRPQGRRPGHRPRRRAAGAAGGHDPAQDRAHARHRGRPRGAHGAARGRRALARAGRGGGRARDVLAARLLARRRRRRLHARRRPQLARPPLRLRLQPGRRDRAGRRLGRAAHGRRRERPRPVLGDARRRRRLRGRHRAAACGCCRSREIYAGALVFPAEVGAEAVRAYRDWAAGSPRR